VVLVRWIRRPVAGRRHDLAGDELVGWEGLRHAEVRDPPAARAGAAGLDGYLAGSPVPRLEALVATGGGQGEPTAAAGLERGDAVAGQVAEVADAGEHILPAGQLELRAAGAHA